MTSLIPTCGFTRNAWYFYNISICLQYCFDFKLCINFIWMPIRCKMLCFGTQKEAVPFYKEKSNLTGEQALCTGPRGGGEARDGEDRGRGERDLTIQCNIWYFQMTCRDSKCFKSSRETRKDSPRRKDRPDELPEGGGHRLCLSGFWQGICGELGTGGV